MNREKFAWAVSLVLIALLACQLPGTFAQRDDDYAFVRTLVDIHRQVTKNYAEPVNEAELRQAAIDGMLSELDPFSMYVPADKQEDFDRMLEGSFKGVGIQLDQLENGQIEVVSPIDGSPAFKAGVMAGDIILKVNGESIEGLKIAEVIKKVGGQLGTEVTLTFRRVTGEEVTLTMTREEIVVPTIKGYQRKEDQSWDYYISDNPKIAYVRITQFTPDTYTTLKPALEGLLADGMQGLILDLRFNPGGRLDQAIQVVDLFLKEGTIVSTRGRNRSEQVAKATVPDTLPDFPMVVLVNEHSASASEIVAGSLMDNRRALVIGERSYGKGSVQELIELDSKGGELKLTVAYYYLPSGRLVHRKKDAIDWGVQPQIVVPMDAESQARAMRERYEQELHRRPRPKVVTQPSTTGPSTAPATTQPVDLQLQTAVNTMLGFVVFQAHQVDAQTIKPVPVPQVQPPATMRTREIEPSGARPTTQPTTAPETEPAGK
jgi:carboxyl-terminal processing protease